MATTGTGGTGGTSTTTGTGGTGGTSTTTTGAGGMAGTGGMGGMGGSMLCQPGSTMPCYEGPANTKDVGLCHGGLSTCNPDGQSYGACLGEVLPVAETCNTPGDDDCNGVANDQGVGCACAPGSSANCYDGPMGTENKGICKGGMHTCDAQGTGYGPCMGQTLPMAEDCNTVIDENCDGMTPLCPGSTIWSKVMGDTLDDEANSIAVDPTGNVLVGGYGTNSPDFGCGPLAIGANYTALMIKYAPDGTCLWNKAFVDPGLNHKSEVKAITTDGAGNVFASGIYFNGINVGGGSFPNNSLDESDIYLAKFSPAGVHSWSKHFGSAGAQVLKAIRTDSQGNVIITGMFSNQINFGPTAASNLISNGQLDIFVAKFDPAGTYLWSKRFGDASQQAGYGLAVDNNDNVIIVGPNFAGVNFGGGLMTSVGLGDVFVAKLSPAGAYINAKSFGDAADQSAIGAGVDASGNIFVVGTYAGTLNFGGGVSLTTANPNDAWIVKLKPDLTPLWAKSGGGPDNQEFDQVTVDPQGNPIASGFLSGNGDFGAGNLVSGGVQDMLVVKYDAMGNTVWSKRFGAAGTELGRAVAANAAGESYATGVCAPTDFGSGVQSGLGGEELCVVKLAP
jgi:hypothetical protein